MGIADIENDDDGGGLDVSDQKTTGAGAMGYAVGEDGKEVFKQTMAADVGGLSDHGKRAS